jgi:hypothetical protein
MKQAKRGVWGGLAALLLGTVAAGCASTQMANTWTDPTARGAPLSKVAVVCVSRDESVRRVAEDDMARRMTNAVPSYQVLGDADMSNKEAVRAKLESQGFDGALVMRLAGVTEHVVPGTGPYGSFYGYYDYAYNTAYGPAGPQVETVVRVENRLYSLKDDKLIWTGQSKTFDPSSTKQAVEGVTTEVAKALQKERLIL